MSVQISTHLRRQAIYPARLRAVAQEIMTEAGAADADLSVALVGDRRMRGLNRKYRGRDQSTDVLAFAMREARGPDSSLLGDVVISFDTALRQARTVRHSVDQEVVRLLIHGILHLLGYDHEGSDRETRRMHDKERAVFHALAPLPRLIRPRSHER
jgi:probable rRNA maturation factor